MVGHQLDHRLWRDHAHDHRQVHQGRVCSRAMGEVMKRDEFFDRLCEMVLGTDVDFEELLDDDGEGGVFVRFSNITVEDEDEDEVNS